MTRRLVAAGTRLRGQPHTLRTTMNTTDIYIYRSAQALPPLPGEHIEAVQLDMTTRDGREVIIDGRISVFEPTHVIFVEVVGSHGRLDREGASNALQHAIEHRLIGSDVVRSAVERDFVVKGYGDRVEAAQ